MHWAAGVSVLIGLCALAWQLGWWAMLALGAGLVWLWQSSRPG